MQHINSFTMYFDYFNLIDTLSLKDKAILLIAINDYMFKDIEPNLSGHNQAIFNTLKNQLNLSKCNSKRKSKKETEQEPNKNQKETEQVPKENKTSILSFKFYISNFKFINNNDQLISKIEDWLNYKKQRKDKQYTEIGLKTLLNKIDKTVEEFGNDKVINLIDDSIANNYQGIIFEKLKNTQTYSNNNSFSNQKWEETKREFMNND